MEKKAFKAKANDSWSPVDRDVYLFPQRFWVFENKNPAPAPVLQVESTVTIIPPHIFSQNYFFAPNVYLPTIIWIYIYIIAV